MVTTRRTSGVETRAKGRASEELTTTLAEATPGSRLVVILAAAISVTVVAALIAVSIALRAGDGLRRPRAAPVVSAATSANRGVDVGEEIDVSDGQLPFAALPSAAPVGVDLAAVEPLVTSDPEAALIALRELSPRDESEAQRQKVLEIRALVGLQRIGSARTQARVYYDRWPNGPHTAALERLTGRHPQK